MGKLKWTFMGLKQGNQSWVFIRRTDAEAETPILWPPDAKNWLIWKDPDARKDWGQEEKGTTEDIWMASPTQWTWVWVDSGNWWTGRPGVLWFMGSQRVRHDWATELNWTELILLHYIRLYGPKGAPCPVLCLVAQSRPILCNPMDCSPPGYSIRGDSPAKNTKVGCYALLQGIFPTQVSNLGISHCKWILYHLSH